MVGRTRPLPSAPAATRPVPPARPVQPPAAEASAVQASATRAPEAPAEVIPPEELPLDPRTIARASLAAGRNRSLWWTASGIAATVGVAFLTDAVVGTYVLALLLLASAVVRGIGPSTGPVAVSVRSKPLDVLALAGSATALVVLASVLPPG